MELTELKKPFPEQNVEWRAIRSGSNSRGPWVIIAPYIQSRAIMERLDEVCGPENWQMKHEVAATGVITSIGIKIGDEWVWKSDGAGFTDVEAFKGGISDAIKRAGVPWGIGRYLYDLATPIFAKIEKDGKYTAKIDGEYVKWSPPAMSDLSQKHQEAPESTQGATKEVMILKLKKATDEGLYSEDEMADLIERIYKLTNGPAIEMYNKKLDEGIARRRSEAA